MSHLPFDPLLVSIATPLALALLIALGLPKRWSVKLSYVAFAVPMVLSLVTWIHFNDVAHDSGYAFLKTYSTGLDAVGISLKLGLTGMSMALVAMVLAFTGWRAVYAVVSPG